MNILTVSLMACGAATALSLSPLSPARAQDTHDIASAPPTAAASHGDWTLRQREDWLNDRLEKSRVDASLDRTEYHRVHDDLTDLRHEEDHMRGAAHGQLTDNQTADLEGRLDAIAAKIHWANTVAYSRPW